MHNSIIITFIVSLSKKLLKIYDNSFLEKTIASVCGFFKKMASGSFICNLFSNKFLDGSFWRESLIFRVVTSPIKLVLFIGKKLSQSINEKNENSTILKIFDNILYIPLREFGFLVSSFFVGSIVTKLLSGGISKGYLYYAVIMAVLSVVMLIIPASVSSVCKNSVFFGAFLRIFNRYKIESQTEISTYNIKPLELFCVIFFIAGLLAGILSPEIVFITLVLCVGVIIALKNTLMCVLLCVFFAPILPTMACVGLVLLSIASFIIKLIVTEDRKFILTPMDFMIFAFLALSAFSALTSFNREKSLLVLMLYVVFALMYFVIVNTVKTKNQWYNLVTVFVFSGLFVGFYGIYQNFFFDATQMSGWVDKEMFEDISARVYSTFDNPNVLGQYLVLVIPVAFALCVSAKKAFERIVFFLICAVMLLCLIFTWSRAAWVAIVLALGFFVVMKDRRWSTICIVALIIMPFVLPESIISRITSIGNMKDSSTAYRVSVWIASLRIAKDYWISGIGLGSGAFERIYQHYALNGAGFALHSHNFYIQLVVEMGILALLVFLAIIFLSYKQIVGIKEKKSVNKNVALAIGGAIIGYLFQGMAENIWYNYRMVLIFWIYIAILQSGAMLLKNEDYPSLK